MSPFDFSQLIRDLGVQLEATAIDSISTTGAFVRGEKLGFIYNEDFDQGLHFYVDLGRLQQPDLTVDGGRIWINDPAHSKAAIRRNRKS